MTALDIFTYSGQQVRTVIVDGEPWFVVADVAGVLGLTNPTMAAQAIFPDDLSSAEVIDSMGRTQTARITSEPGLYQLIFQSRKAEARDFQKWVTHEVLPQIRKSGQYGTALPANFAEALELAAATVRELEAAEAQLALVAPKVAAYETLMDADGAYSMDAAAKILGIGRTTLFNRLRAEGIIQAGQRTPYQRYAHHFNVTAHTYTDSEEVAHTSFTSKVRPSGLDFIAKKLGLVAVAS